MILVITISFFKKTPLKKFPLAQVYLNLHLIRNILLLLQCLLLTFIHGVSSFVQIFHVV